MKKEFIDFMYELRSLIQSDIDRLYELTKQIETKETDVVQAELRTRRSQIQSLNKTIEKYFETHSKPIN